MFEDLKFEAHSMGQGMQARMVFPNNYGVSVVIGDLFYSNGVDTYELAIIGTDGHLDYTTGLTDDVLGGLTADEVSEIMVKVAKL